MNFGEHNGVGLVEIANMFAMQTLLLVVKKRLDTSLQEFVHFHAFSIFHISTFTSCHATTASGNFAFHVKL